MSAFDATKTVNHILVVIAMEMEARPFIEKLGLVLIPSVIDNSPSLIYGGTRNGFKISVATNGKCPTHGVDNVCTVPAALSTFLAVHQLHPDLVINAGTAGGFSAKGAAIGDAFISSQIKHHDRRIPIPGFTAYGIGNHESLSCPNLVLVQT